MACPNCGHQDAHHGAFNKDCAGQADGQGCRYWRFICHSNHRCGKSMGVIEFIEMCKDIEEIHSIDYSYEFSGLGQVTSRESLESSRLLSSNIMATPITPNLISRENPLPTTIKILTSSPQLPASSISTGILDSDMQGRGLGLLDILEGVAQLSHKLDGVVSNGNLVQNLVPSKEKIYEEVIQVTPTILGEAEITGYGASSTCSSLLQQDPTQATLPLDIQFDTT
ncbi:hypothetical protein L873DRAFT_1792308 [Choiromyces venosus 120613-1]|uniref:Uncharacterized protein n=1 Tax=Choiromyces venosus 120613-1 TaxID=1336337 RepID=A0A3N4JAX9_9PEZI|nr:hypothetical protein L873DRAFT_1792308 [Choiromyces venosus 120613-1]